MFVGLPSKGAHLCSQSAILVFVALVGEGSSFQAGLVDLVVTIPAGITVKFGTDPFWDPRGRRCRSGEHLFGSEMIFLCHKRDRVASPR